MSARPFYASQDLPICGATIKGPRGKPTRCQRAPDDNPERKCRDCAAASLSGVLAPPVDEYEERQAIQAEGNR